MGNSLGQVVSRVTVMNTAWLQTLNDSAFYAQPFNASVPAGAWSSMTTYAVNQYVVYPGYGTPGAGVFQCISQVASAITPPNDPTHWILVQLVSIAAQNTWIAQQAVKPIRGTITGAVTIVLSEIDNSTGLTITSRNNAAISSNNYVFSLSGDVSSLSIQGGLDGGVYNIGIAAGTHAMPASKPANILLPGGTGWAFTANGLDLISLIMGVPSAGNLCGNIINNLS